MVEGPADRRKRRLAESDFQSLESVAWNLESKDRNLPQRAGTSCRIDTSYPEANAVAESASSTFESKIQTTESNERNLSQIAGDLRQVVRNSGRPESDQVASLPWRRASFVRILCCQFSAVRSPCLRSCVTAPPSSAWASNRALVRASSFSLFLLRTSTALASAFSNRA